MQNLIEALILDMDGVLWRDTEPIGDLPTLFQRIESRGWKTAFVTNNATRSPKQYVEKLASFGVHANQNHIINSGLATALYLQEQYPSGGPVYIIGEEGLINTLYRYGFHQSEQEPLAVISSLDRRLEYKKLEIATALVRAGVPFIGTNPDPALPTPKGYIPGAGSILAALETASGVKPHIIGKPMPTMFQITLKRLNIEPGEALVVGDQMETDIAAGIAAGCFTALVLSGITDESKLDSYQYKPTFIATDFTQLIDQLT